MADDSVPLPFPNLRVPAWQYQITSVPALKDQASSSFWKAVEEDGKPDQTVLLYKSKLIRAEMAPYLQYIESDRTDLITSLSEKNKKHLEELETKLKEAEENQGDSEISELLRSKAMYLCRIGDKVGRIILEYR